MESSNFEDKIQIGNENNINTHSNEQDIVVEGKATVRLSNEDKSFSAFYNPAQVRIHYFLKNI
jgi:hypothetical protein